MFGPAFFYHVLKPGRYLGGEIGVDAVRPESAGPAVVWYYPDRYELAMADAGWRRGYFQLARRPDVRCLRAVEYAADVWEQMTCRGLPPFTIDGHSDLREADQIIFWAPDPLRAARIPGIVRRLGLGDAPRPRVGVVVDGLWAPRFLLGHVDWVVPAAGGWLPRSVDQLLSGGSRLPEGICDGRDSCRWEEFWSDRWEPGPLMPVGWARTPRWVPRVEIGDDFAAVDLAAPDEQGILRPRFPAAVVADALEGLRVTGIDGVRFCGSGFDHSPTVATALTEMGRRYNMKRVRAHWPALTPESFASHWESYKPHLLKPVLRLLIDAHSDVQQVTDLGRRALNAGWHGLTVVMTFASFAELSAMLPSVRRTIETWYAATEGFSDKRPLRLEYRPAPIDRWDDPPSVPNEDDLRRFCGEFRHFKEDMSKWAAAGVFRVEELIARNWLAASDLDLWPRLARLELSDPNDEEAPAFDWYTWVRHESGMDAAPTAPFVRVPARSLEAGPMMTSPGGQLSDLTELEEPGEGLFGRRRRKNAFTRRLAAPSLTRMRVRWGRDASWRLYSHLDLVRAVERAIRRAGLPAAYSEGFHPRLRLSFGPPLAFGLISSAEYFDLILEDDYESEFAERLARALPEGVTLIEAGGMPNGVPALTDIINDAVFRAIIPLTLPEAQERLERFGTQKEIRWQRPDRADRKPLDPRKNLLNTSVEPTAAGTQWHLDIRVGGEGNLRPADWTTLLFGFTPEDLAEIVIERTALLIRQGGKIRTPFETL